MKFIKLTDPTNGGLQIQWEDEQGTRQSTLMSHTKVIEIPSTTTGNVVHGLRTNALTVATKEEFVEYQKLNKPAAVEDTEKKKINNDNVTPPVVSEEVDLEDEDDLLNDGYDNDGDENEN